MLPTRPAEIEGWTLQVLDAVAAGRTVEDSRVDLKKTLPEPKKAARRIAGHANAAGGDIILWVIGVDEAAGLVGYEEEEDRADWWAKVSAEFDGGIAPFLRDVIVPRGDRRFLALCYETDRAPYVVKNPNGGGIDREVPWREGTAVRSAKREDLLRLLLPIARRPEVEVLYRSLLTPTGETQPGIGVMTELLLYLIPNADTRIVIPRHRCSVRVTDGREQILAAGEIRCRLPNAEHQQSGFQNISYRTLRAQSSQPTVNVHAGQRALEENDTQCSLSEPALVEIMGRWPAAVTTGFAVHERPVVEFRLGFAGRATPLTVSVPFVRGADGKYTAGPPLVA